MSLFQAILLGLGGWLTNSRTPYLGGPLICWYGFGRPLVSGFIIGIILNDVQTAIIVAAAVQALYIGTVTPGGGWYPDMTFATWIAVPLAVSSGAGSEVAVALAAPIGVITSFGITLLESTMIAFVHKMDERVAHQDFKGVNRVVYLSGILNFILRFVPICLINYFGQDFLYSLMDVMPAAITGVLTVFGGIMPLVGFAILLRIILKENAQIVYVLFGFVLITVFGVDITTVVICAAVLALIEFKTYRKEEKHEQTEQ